MSTSVDDKQLIALAQAGDQQAATTLILRYKRWATWTADKIARQHDKGRKQEMHAAAVAGLWEAILRFDCTRDTSYMSYAVWYVRKYVHEQINEYMQSHGMSDIDLYADDLHAGDADSDATGSVISSLRRLVDTPTSPKGDSAFLSPVERSVLALKMRDMNQVEIAQELCVSKQRINQICKQLSAKLQQLL